ncbi:hypothetical protein UG55_110120 [Frankia sp. EI5c]|nr:hypothetical protein UG55_110120 [Frankia sp. EI5c]
MSWCANQLGNSRIAAGASEAGGLRNVRRQAGRAVSAGRRWRKQTAGELQLSRLLGDARHADRAGNIYRAVTIQSSAVRIVVELHAESPGDRHLAQLLGGVQYDLAALCHRAGDLTAAVSALNAGEQIYAALVDQLPAAAGRLADVRIRRGVVHAAQGHGVSALADVRAALGGPQAADPAAAGPDGLRVLALGGDVLAAFGDPDLALVTVDNAVRAGLRSLAAPGTVRVGAAAAPHPGYLARACRVAAVLRRARGPAETARARRLAAAADRLGAVPAATVVEQRLAGPNPPDLTLGLAAALRAAERHGGDPRTSACLLAALDSPHSGPAQVPAARLSAMLTRLAGEVLTGDLAVGMRLLLEAHCLRTAPATPAGPARAHAVEPADLTWARLLHTASRRLAAAGDTGLAVDLAGWAARAAQDLTGADSTDLAAALFAAECARTHAELAPSPAVGPARRRRGVPLKALPC